MKSREGLGAFITIGHKVDKVGKGRYSNMYVPHLKVNFLPVMTSSFNHAEVWSPKLW